MAQPPAGHPADHAAHDDPTIYDVSRRAVLARDAPSEQIRLLDPERAQLENRLRYLLLHGRQFVVDAAQSGVRLCRLRVTPDQAQPLAREPLESLREDPSARSRAGIVARPGEPVPAAGLVEAILRWAGAPVALRDLVDIVAAAAGLPVRSPDAPQEAGGEDRGERPDGAVRAGAAGTGERGYLGRLWDEIVLLPPRQRAALLLNMRDADGRDCILALPAAGVASLTDIARAVEMSVDHLARIWNDLPWEDTRIAGLLGLSRQQVVNLRKSARARLARRLYGF
jgi:hypothetical protein